MVTGETGVVDDQADRFSGQKFFRLCKKMIDARKSHGVIKVELN